MAHEDQWIFEFDKPLEVEHRLNAERVECYKPGGLHPVDVGDEFQTGRYQIVRKLGHGSSSSVWLAQDTTSGSDPRYVAIKILGAKASEGSKEVLINRSIAANKAASEHVVTLLDSFRHVGPNGEHDCLVFEPMGPDVATCFGGSIPYWQGRSICKQLLAALQCLHDLKIAHSDTNPGNVLLSLTQPIEQLAVGGRSVPTRVAGERNPCVPEYIHEDRPLMEFWDNTALAVLKLSDFGAAFTFDDPPQTPLTAAALRAPEVVLQSSFDHRIDIWSFACYLFEVFTGQPLFNLGGLRITPMYDDHPHSTKDDNDQLRNMTDDAHLLQITSTLAPLPPALFEKWPRRTRYFDADLHLVRTDVGPHDDALGAIYVGETLEQRFQHCKPRGMTAAEAADLVRVLRVALQCDLAKRPSAAELLRLGWFCRV